VSHELILKKPDIDAMDERNLVHPFNDDAVINMKSLGDAVGLTRLGMHLVRIAPGDETTASHNHEVSEEFVYIFSGLATLYIGEQEYELEAGDFAGFPAGGPPHFMKNTGEEELVYIMAGTRPENDVINYPRSGKKLYKYDGRLEYVDTDDIKELKPKR
jgi:uncharacterized cupin superfamily protein